MFRLPIIGLMLLSVGAHAHALRSTVDVAQYGMTLPSLEQLRCFAKKISKPFNSQEASEAEKAFLLSLASALAYSEAKDLKDFTELLKLRRLDGFREKKVEAEPLNLNVYMSDTNLIWLETETDIVVAFGGTNPDNKLHKATDAQVAPFPFDFGKVHNGFHNALDIVWPKLWEKLLPYLQQADPKKRLHFTGHSLGAAIGTLATGKVLTTKFAYGDFASLFTFGSPLVGNDDFVNEYLRLFAERKNKPQHLRFVHSNDMVARIPESLYTHIGAERYFDDDGKLHEETEAQARILPLVKLDPFKLVIDHDIRFYIEYSYRQWSGAADSNCL